MGGWVAAGQILSVLYIRGMGSLYLEILVARYKCVK